VTDAYPFALREHEIDWRPTVLAMLRDRGDPARASARFHNTLAAMIVAVCERERPERVALSGGCFANALLHERVAEALAERAITTASNERVPCGDGGIALGQAWVASRG
jgi:hydrogenase maturation protein HypF